MHFQFVENMLSVHKKYKDLIEEVFSNDQVMLDALDKACNQVINHQPNPNTPSRSPEWVSILDLYFTPNVDSLICNKSTKSNYKNFLCL